MKINAKRFIFCSLLVTLFIFPLYFSISHITNHKSEEFFRENSLQISTIYDTPIAIDDLPGSLTNWSWAKNQGYCTGSGTSGDPYIIKNHIFNTSTIVSSPLWIQHSLKHFVIEDCFFIAHSAFAGIYLVNVSNGKMMRNSMGFPTGALIYMRNSSYNIISNNNASYGTAYGIVLSGSIGPTRYNTISNNLVSSNLDTGIILRSGCENNIISENSINDGLYGIELEPGTTNNVIYLNCFNNTSNALDDGTNNHWDNGINGNYWEDYPGVDANEDGIGDTPYDISGSAGNQDNYPLMECPEQSASSGKIPGYDMGIFVSSLFLLIIGTVYSALKKKRNNHTKQ